jgi:hypothetical protein
VRDAKEQGEPVHFIQDNTPARAYTSGVTDK